MTRRRLEQEQAKKLILDEAEKLFIEKGFTRATMEELRKRCGMSKGNLYYHFKNKEEIMMKIIENFVEKSLDEFDDVTFPGQTCSEKLFAFIELSSQDLSNPLLKPIEEFGNEKDDNTQFENIISALFNKTINYIKGIVREGIQNEEFKPIDEDTITINIISMLAGITQLCMIMPEIASKDYVQVQREALNNLFEGLSS